MIITTDVLKRFDACNEGIEIFGNVYPNGVDISPLWGTFEESSALWLEILSTPLKMYIGWGLRVGVIPKIRANLRGADLAGANLAGANLRWADLEGANLAGADLEGAIGVEVKNG